MCQYLSFLSFADMPLISDEDFVGVYLFLLHGNFISTQMASRTMFTFKAKTPRSQTTKSKKPVISLS